jgi:S-DNA-T family DNA segregation ATPase FtsK/SpoIIIE
VHAVVSGTFGRVGLVLPLVLLGLGLRILRHPQDAESGGRIGVGLGALVLAVLGLVHIARGLPDPAHGVALREGGGYLGYLVSSPLVAAVSTYVAVPLLVLLLLFGLLVVTATPLHALPDRGKAVLAWLMHRPAEAETGADGDGDGDETADPEAVEPLKRRRPRRRQGSMAGDADDDKPYDDSVVGRHDAPDAADQSGDAAGADGEEKPPPAHSPMPVRSSSCCSRATSPTRCLPPTCSARARRTGPARRPATRSSSR